MIDLKKIVRPNILELEQYSSARDEFSGKEGVFLDANENPFGQLNRYPDPYQINLKAKIENLKGIKSSNIFVGNGSDEIIDLALRIFCNPGKDKALTFIPTYGMYAVSAAINNVELLQVPLNEEFQIDLKKVEPFLEDENLKLIFICSPNNPTGNLIDKKEILFLLNNFKGIVIIDEAYIDFSESESFTTLLNEYDNLIVSQTFSKAWGLAAARVGIAFAPETIISLFNKVKPPYNVSQLNQLSAIEAIENEIDFKENVNIILKEKERLKNELIQLAFVKKVYPSAANFFLVEVVDAEQLYNLLIEQKIIIRNRNKQVKNTVRITIGSIEENNRLINALKKIK
ncbi:histidinol-phosphate transaminase [Crocinitomicaceae bacterium]|nr:histidinol-phosphate transaminase [Crocinitomicaceae bacterium]